MVTEAWLRQRGLLCPAYSCCPATLAKAACLYVLTLYLISSCYHSCFYHSLLCPPLLRAIIVFPLWIWLLAYILHSALYLPSFSPLLSLCLPLFFPLLLLLLSTDSLFCLSLTQTHHSHKCTLACRWCMAAVWVHCPCDGLEEPLLNYSVAAAAPPPLKAQA